MGGFVYLFVNILRLIYFCIAETSPHGGAPKGVPLEVHTLDPRSPLEHSALLINCN